ncbi:right-handed parallel beta-helix repeat-containing protein (plasmid) [Nostoc sp. UHCC 0302]|uniref:right-handed parallel beta-helix repeat-containing protein n=1 Tax=Nostoc sp. UHCC 0302 TaxID=3134896 RepID=UPI00311C922D
MTTRTVTTTADTGTGSLRAAIFASINGDSIVFAPALAGQTLTVGSTLIIAKNITVDASAAPMFTISGNNAFRCMALGQGTTITIKGLTFINGYMTGSFTAGGLTTSSYCNTTVLNCTFRGNKGDTSGAIHAGFQSKLVVRNNLFENNDGTQANNGFAAGGIATRNRGSLEVYNCDFFNNKGVVGGAIYRSLGGLIVEDSEFGGNTSKQGGGAIYTDGFGQDSETVANRVGGLGRLSRCYFHNNIALAGNGGAVNFFDYYPDTSVVEDCIITDNECRGTYYGGGIRLAGTTQLLRTTIASNISARDAGGLWLDGYINGSTATVTLIQVTFSANSAVRNGGAISINGSAKISATFDNITAKDNLAAGSGFMWNPVGSYVVSDSVFDRNSGTNGQQIAYTLTEGGGNYSYPAVSGTGKKITPSITQVDPLLDVLTTTGRPKHPKLVNSPIGTSGDL